MKHEHENVHVFLPGFEENLIFRASRHPSSAGEALPPRTYEAGPPPPGRRQQEQAPGAGAGARGIKDTNTFTNQTAILSLQLVSGLKMKRCYKDSLTLSVSQQQQHNTHEDKQNHKLHQTRGPQQTNETQPTPPRPKPNSNRPTATTTTEMTDKTNQRQQMQ